MGGGSSSSKQQTDQSTKVTTTTSTNVGDIGLTGKDAVNLAGILAQSSSNNVIAATDLVKPVADIFAQGFDRVTKAATDIAAVEKTPTQSIAENLPLIIAAAGAAVFLYGVAK